MQPKPIFNKRLYKAHAGITISKQASSILRRKPNQPRSQSDLRAIRPVIVGLKEIHKNLEFVKAALGHAVTYEKHESDVRIEKQLEETRMSCYYILSGSVEAFYTVRNSSNPFHESEERTISSTNVAGDYIGLVSADGPNFDLPPPEFMTTIEHSEFLRIDRDVFHQKIQEAQKLFRDEIVRFLDGNVLFEKITEEDRQKLVSQMVKQEFPAGKQILSQGQKQEHAFFIAEGRCVYYRRLYLPEQRRSELFKMGYVEKGSYFDASCIIDNQSSKFSVSAVGPVTCYLLNKWTIKNSESLLGALSANRPSFPTDQEIESLIKESDQWQSYKRDAVCDAFLSKNKASSRIVSQNEIPKTLDVAIKHGTVLRQQRQKELVTPTDDLDPSGRKSGVCSPQIFETTEVENTKSVLKAVMLMKRSRGSIQMENPNDKMNPNSNADQKNGNTLNSWSLKEERKKSNKNLKHQAIGNQKVSSKIDSTKQIYRKKQKHPKTIQNRTSKFTNQRDPTGTPSSPNGRKGKRTAIKTLHEKNIANQLEAPPQERPSSSPIPYARAQHRKPEFDDRWVANDKKFKVKEIVNTRILGKEIPADAYRRFEPSMFEYVDKINSFEKEKESDPFGTKLKARAWLKEVKGKLAARGSEYHPGQSPIIVIEEFCAGNEAICNEIGYESRDQKIAKAKVGAGSMETLLEDSDKENAEAVKKFEWRTAVHETRYEAERCLERAKIDIAILEQHLQKLGWTREMLIAKERKRNERKTRSSRSNEEKSTIENIEHDETEKVNEKKIERRIKTLKRQDSIQKILEDHSRRLYRRNRSFSEEKPQVKRRTLVKRYSTGNVPSAGSVSRSRTPKTRTFTLS